MPFPFMSRSSARGGLGSQVRNSSTSPPGLPRPALLPLATPQDQLARGLQLISTLQMRDKSPSEAMASLRNLFDWLCSATESAKEVIEKVPVASDYTPIVSAVLFVATLWGKGKRVEEKCAVFATRLCSTYGRLLALRNPTPAPLSYGDPLEAGYKTLLAELFKMAGENKIGARRRIRLGLSVDDLLGRLTQLHKLLDELQLDDADIVGRMTYSCVTAGFATLERRLVQVERGGVGKGPVTNPPLDPPPSCPVMFGRPTIVSHVLAAIAVGASGRNDHVVLVGVGGIGKSTLALNVLHHPTLATRFTRRVFIRCDRITTSEALQVEMLRLRGDALKNDESLFSALQVELERVPTLLVLDNFETTYDSPDKLAVAGLVKRLADIPSLTLLVTTRNASVCELNVNRRLQGVVLGPLDFTASKDLFDQRSNPTGRHKTDPALPELLTRLEGLPLAITLVAARANEDTIAEVIELWERRKMTYLNAGRILSRDESLQYSLDLSLHSPLITGTPYAKDLLALLSVLPRGISSRRLQSEGLDDLFSSAVTAVLNTSLAHLTDDSTDKTLRLLSPVAEYLRDPSSGIEAPSPDVLRLVALSYFDDCKTLPIFQGRLAGTKLPSDFRNLFEIFVRVEHIADRSFRDARANALLDLIERFDDDQIPKPFIGFLRENLDEQRFPQVKFADGVFALFRSLGRTCRALCSDLFSGCFGKTHDDRSEPQIKLAMLYYIGLLDGDLSLLEKALVMLRNFNRPITKGDVLVAMGSISSGSDAQDYYNKALIAFSSVPESSDPSIVSISQLGAANCIFQLGFLERESDPCVAMAEFIKAQELYKQLKWEGGIANCVFQLGDLKCQSDPPAAIKHFTEAKTLYEKLKWDHDVANCLFQLGVLKCQSERTAALNHLTEAKTLYEKVNWQHGAANSLFQLGVFECVRDPPAAIKYFIEAKSIYEKLGLEKGFANCLFQLGFLTRESDRSAALYYFTAAKTLYEKLEREENVANCLFQLGLPPCEPTVAKNYFAEAACTYAKLGVQQGYANCLDRMKDLNECESDPGASSDRLLPQGTSSV